MEFTAIATQEQFDAAIGERLKRERETLAKKYGDYDELKTKIIGYEKQIGEMSKNAADASKRYAGYDKTLAELQSKIKGYESASLKARIAHEVGLSYELAGRLSGDDEDSIRKDAEAISQLIGRQKHKAPPLRSTEPEGLDDKKATLRTLTTQLSCKGD